MTNKLPLRLALAITALLSWNALSFAQAALPTIDIGHSHKTTAKIIKPPLRPHQQASSLPPRPSNLVSTDQASSAPSAATQILDGNQSFGSSAQQNTALGPRISYPLGPKEQNSSSERFFTGGQINTLPAFRPGEALEVVPGLAVVPHNSEGMASLYYLRGFDLDHGTDLAFYLDSMPLNMRTHGHGQGYADANFVIPEMLAYVDARKGAYNVEDGDFSNAGTLRMQYLQKVPSGVFTSTAGAFGYGRQFGMKSWEYAGGDILGGGEISVYNGPWTTPNHTRKINSVLRWSKGDENNGVSVTGMAYANRWISADQIPLRAVDTNQMSRWGSINPTDGGDTTRFSLSGRWAQETANYHSKVEAFAVRSSLDLFNDYTVQPPCYVPLIWRRSRIFSGAGGRIRKA